ncbi:MAG TPA: peptidoglycan recognition family protein [Bryobacteraceae bacterium]|nr:peptidoglycan recognition family protein [Bryobacteraceae bacterium]
MRNAAIGTAILRLRAPGRPLAGWLEWRASQLSDPVARLRYLRRSAAFWGGQPIRRTLQDVRIQRLSAFLAAALLLPIPMVTDGAAPRRTMQASFQADSFPNVWVVENTADHELYSNGLRVEKRYLAAPRDPMAFQRWRIDTDAREEGVAPYGIVFHTTESDAAAYEESNNRKLRRAAEGTLGFVQSQRAYHFVIDRFGRVFRTVPENEPANHAGASVWADDKYYFVNMNHSFLGVSFDGQTRGADGKPSVTEPQVTSARLLTDILRARYRIPTENCVTHAQVSVNSGNMGVGYHTDWAAGFPFAQLGLPVNYLTPLPAITLFGFGFEDYYSSVAADELQDGISAGETVLRQEASRRGLSTAAYRRLLAKRFRDVADPHRYVTFAEAETRSTNP